ncbi:hypothetical protein LXA43DRAFT_1061154 [Ganoderma leucocontextum]|nr:hypothetical protein LXA43DRAFT_1061154 [Ganoderma leucocontextum]
MSDHNHPPPPPSRTKVEGALVVDSNTHLPSTALTPDGRGVFRTQRSGVLYAYLVQLVCLRGYPALGRCNVDPPIYARPGEYLTKTAKYPDIASNLLIGRDRREALRGPAPRYLRTHAYRPPPHGLLPCQSPSAAFPRTRPRLTGNDVAQGQMTGHLHERTSPLVTCSLALVARHRVAFLAQSGTTTASTTTTLVSGRVDINLGSEVDRRTLTGERRGWGPARHGSPQSRTHRSHPPPVPVPVPVPASNAPAPAPAPERPRSPGGREVDGRGGLRPPICRSGARMRAALTPRIARDGRGGVRVDGRAVGIHSRRRDERRARAKAALRVYATESREGIHRCMYFLTILLWVASRASFAFAFKFAHAKLQASELDSSARRPRSRFAATGRASLGSRRKLRLPGLLRRSCATNSRMYTYTAYKQYSLDTGLCFTPPPPPTSERYCLPRYSAVWGVWNLCMREGINCITIIGWEHTSASVVQPRGDPLCASWPGGRNAYAELGTRRRRRRRRKAYPHICVPISHDARRAVVGNRVHTYVARSDSVDPWGRLTLPRTVKDSDLTYDMARPFGESPYACVDDPASEPQMERSRLGSAERYPSRPHARTACLAHHDRSQRQTNGKDTINSCAQARSPTVSWRDLARVHSVGDLCAGRASGMGKWVRVYGTTAGAHGSMQHRDLSEDLAGKANADGKATIQKVEGWRAASVGCELPGSIVEYIGSSTTHMCLLQYTKLCTLARVDLYLEQLLQLRWREYGGRRGWRRR